MTLKIYKVRCANPSCGKAFHIFRNDDRVPRDRIKCVDCWKREEGEKVMSHHGRFHFEGGLRTIDMFIGYNDDPLEVMERCMDREVE